MCCVSTEERRLLDAVLFKAGVELGSRQTSRRAVWDLLPSIVEAL